MGRTQREKPARLGEKLLQIRQSLGLSQSEMLRHLGLEDRLQRDDISKYERDVREPSLIVLLAYAEAANIYVDALIKDSVNLPDVLPSRKKHEGVERATLSRRKH
jgi:transcriptional regulator with XRE-family HTH domain